jgi:hypothetical protein
VRDGLAHWRVRLNEGINASEAVAADVRDRLEIEYTDRSRGS